MEFKVQMVFRVDQSNELEARREIEYELIRLVESGMKKNGIIGMYDLKIVHFTRKTMN